MTDVHVVAVGDEYLFAGEGHELRLREDLDAAFAREVIAHPHIVVAREKHDPHPPVRQIGQPAQHAHEPFGDHFAVFEPEVEHIAHQKDRLRIAARVVEPRRETAFDFAGALFAAASQMDIGREIDHFRPVSSSILLSRLLPYISSATMLPPRSIRKLVGSFEML